MPFDRFQNAKKNTYIAIFNRMCVKLFMELNRFPAAEVSCQGGNKASKDIDQIN